MFYVLGRCVISRGSVRVLLSNLRILKYWNVVLYTPSKLCAFWLKWLFLMATRYAFRPNPDWTFLNEGGLSLAERDDIGGFSSIRQFYWLGSVPISFEVVLIDTSSLPLRIRIMFSRNCESNQQSACCHLISKVVIYRKCMLYGKDLNLRLIADFTTGGYNPLSANKDSNSIRRTCAFIVSLNKQSLAMELMTYAMTT